MNINQDDILFIKLFRFVTNINEIAHKVQSSGFRGQGRIIHLLAQEGEPLTQRELAERAHIKPGSLSQLLERMDRQKIIARHRCSNDRRVVKVSLTAKGQSMYDQINQQRVEFEQNLTKDLTDGERQHFCQVLDRMEHSLQHYYGDQLEKGMNKHHD
ncbi:hypothetical protein FD27_GL001662 [Limosilactobacillus frumenti DSM 13145]|uniref:HTH marR-type domain-containing protein n=1 Tax=Limosilactobacillus frumenti DSM 13145 TaxID=1423746 RepID=A0A0R1P872_9LACO|nr:MarR family transcriptional regulator [Limosilactobacillus frumenti]KRL28662.1 hypothetical protein FD27_GL001662 [Limosilactobacillus frumenti DSM 13145]MBA2914120.1 MarR family transcriptional regulator [Limosilactobacillus frumenti]QFG72271.1 MarR family transcriptional regulator [Limosilactobacillus frumenti]